MQSRYEDRRGDERRVCAHYATCPHFTEKWEDKNGAQLYCPVCEAAIYVGYTGDKDAMQA